MSKPTQHPKPQPTASEGLEQRLKLHPELKRQIESLLAIVENQDGRLEKAADAELEVVKGVRQLGRQALQEWGQRQADRKAEELPRLNPSACKDKKTLHWHSLLGKVGVIEQRFRHGRRGASLRPFVVSAEIEHRGYSQPLERAITDFGADGPFARIPQKLKEHYGIEVPVSSARDITQAHGQALLESQSLESEIPERPGVACVVAELDGCMIPIVTPPESSADAPVDRRTRRQLDWREARLALAHPLGSVTPVFGATLGGVEQAGQHWAHCVIQAGAGTQTQIHCVGDGARWIVEQMEQRFGTQGRYLIDFSHLSGYFSAASTSVPPLEKSAWLEQVQKLMKDNQPDAVLDALAPFLEREKPASGEAPVQACYRYISNRPGSVRLPKRLEAGLPIGSGEVESGHRYVIQDRLKIAGAWWKEDNAEKMLALRVVRANNDWEAYWQNPRKKRLEVSVTFNRTPVNWPAQ